MDNAHYEAEQKKIDYLSTRLSAIIAKANNNSDVDHLSTSLIEILAELQITRLSKGELGDRLIDLAETLHYQHKMEEMENWYYYTERHDYE